LNADPGQFLCPACGFRLFNRRHPLCEGCGQALPQELLLSADERVALDAAHQKSRQERKRLDQARRRRKSGDVGDAPIYLGDSGATDFIVGGDGGDGGDGGGGDCGHH
jgi:hypothetical protein